MTHEEVAYHQGRDSIIDALCNWMLENGFTTGHGDNIGAVLAELGEQVAAIRRQRDDERERCAKIVHSHQIAFASDACGWALDRIRDGLPADAIR